MKADLCQIQELAMSKHQGKDMKIHQVYKHSLGLILLSFAVTGCGSDNDSVSSIPPVVEVMKESYSLVSIIMSNII